MMDETRDDSFTLLSSMSPKIDKEKKKVAKNKAPSKLALKSTLRRSSFYDKLPPTLNNKNIKIVEASTDNSSDTGSSDKPASVIFPNEGKIERTDILSKTKFTNIIKWIDDVQSGREEDNHNISTLSTISSIQGDLRADDNFGAINSTFADGIVHRRFEDFFVKVNSQFENLHVDRKKSNLKNDKIPDSYRNKVIDDPFKLTRKKGENNLYDFKNKELVNTSFERKEINEKEKLKKCIGNAEVKNVDDSVTKKAVDNRKSNKIENPFKALKEKYVEAVKNDNNSLKEFKNSSKISKENKKGKVTEEVLIKKYVGDEDIDNSLEDDIINDSFEALKKKNVENIAHSFHSDNNSIHEDEVLVIEDSFEANKENDIVIEEGYLDVLDKLYGSQWRKNLDQVLPQSEPRLKKPRAKPKEAPKTEVKPRILPKYNSPNIHSETKRTNNLGNILEAARRKAALESPWVSKLKALCDSESEEEPEQKTNGLLRVRLDFDDTNREATKPKFNEHGKYNNHDGKIKAKGNIEIRNTDYRERKISSNSDDKYDSSSDFDDIGLSLADKLKGKIRAKETKLPKKPLSAPTEKKLVSSSSSDISEDSDRAKAKNVTKKTDRVQTKGRKISSSSSCDTDDKISEFENILKRIDINKETTKSVIKKDDKPLSFLASLSQNVPLSRCDASARIFKNCYKKYRQELLERLFKMFNENIFDNSIPVDTVIEWSDRMRGTAGYCACKKITRRTGKIERNVRLVLSTKVLDSADRLRDTLVHEMCHAATWIVNQVSDGHGPYWKSWASKAMKTYPELPPIKRCHDYNINTKYTYRCIECKYSFGRHSKSVDLAKKRCGYCYGKFELLLNKVTKDGEKKAVQATPKKEPTGFALFVKQNYAQYKNPSLKHGEVMKLLGTKFQEIKGSNS